jgi:hypothetical protein
VRAVITVVCDDTRTAVRYFELLRLEFKEHKTVRVYPAPHCGASADDVIEFAIAKKPEYAEADDRTFVVVDLDTNPDERALRAACDSADLLLALSNPCFEVWTLAHLEDTGEAFLNCDAVLKRVKVRWKVEFNQELNSKAQADYSKIMAFRDEAIRRTRQRNAKNSQSWTEVWKAVESIVT